MITGDDQNDIVSGINVTPLVDITLVLLIIFMVTATFVSEQALKINLPKVVTRENAPAQPLTVSVSRDGQLRLMKREMNLEELKKQLAFEAGLDPGLKVLVKADRALTYGEVAGVLDSIKQAGVNKVALAMDKK